MNTDINQKISQFLDDDLNIVELDELLLKMKKQTELKNKMSRYQTMSEVLKKEHVVLANSDFLDKISQQIDQQPVYFLPQQKVKKNRGHIWQKAGLAIAASIACIAVILSPQEAIQSTEGTRQVVIAQKQIEEPPIQIADSPQSLQHQRLKAYLQAHNDDLYTHGSLNMQPLARVASYRQE